MLLLVPIPLHSLLAPNAPCQPLMPPIFLPVAVLGPLTGVQCGWAPSPSATSQCPLTAPTPPAGPLTLPTSPHPNPPPVRASSGQEWY